LRIFKLTIHLHSLDAAKSTRWLQERGITHAISVCTEDLPFDRAESGVRQLRIAIPDVPHVNLIARLQTACQFIDAALAEGGVVLVLSTEGQSRSAAIAAAYSKSLRLQVLRRRLIFLLQLWLRRVLALLMPLTECAAVGNNLTRLGAGLSLIVIFVFLSTRKDLD
jgi:hypothetical protein